MKYVTCTVPLSSFLPLPLRWKSQHPASDREGYPGQTDSQPMRVSMLPVALGVQRGTSTLICDPRHTCLQNHATDLCMCNKLSFKCRPPPHPHTVHLSRMPCRYCIACIAHSAQYHNHPLTLLSSSSVVCSFH